jgi:hypothetical protein
MRTIFWMTLVLLGGLAAWVLFANTDERAVRRVFGDICKNLQKEGAESPFQAMAQARAVTRHLAAHVHLEGPVPSEHEGPVPSEREGTVPGERVIVDTARLTEQIAALRRECAFLTIQTSDLTIRFHQTDGNRRADVFCNVTVTGLPFSHDFPGGNTFSLTTAFVKDPDSGAWRVTALHAAPIVPVE